MEDIAVTLIKNTFGECFIFHSNLDCIMFLLVRFLSFAYTSTIHGKTLLLFPHLLQAVSDLRFCSLIEILKLTTNHFSIRISRKRISILLNISANRLKFLKAGVNKNRARSRGIKCSNFKNFNYFI